MWMHGKQTLFLQKLDQEGVGGHVDVVALIVFVERGFSADLHAHERLLIVRHIAIGWS